MSIYSTNRAGSVAAIDVVANESYRASDIGRIMYESQVNDMAIFEATLTADFTEINGLREGTMLESEVAAFNEANGKSLFAKLKERLAAFWAKIKGVFKAAIQKFAAYILRDGKAFVKEFEAVESKGKQFVGKLENVAIEVNFNQAVATLPDAQDANAQYEKLKGDKEADGKSARELANTMLADEMGIAVDDFNTAEYRKDFGKKVIGFATIDNHDKAKVALMKSNLSNASSLVKTLKDDETKVNKSIAELKKAIEKSEKDFAEASGADATAILRKATAILGAVEVVVSTKTAAKIAAVKTVARESRKALGQMLSNMKGGAHHESADIAAEDEVDVALDDDVAAPADEDTQAEIDKLVAEA